MNAKIEKIRRLVLLMKIEIQVLFENLVYAEHFALYKKKFIIFQVID